MDPILIGALAPIASKLVLGGLGLGWAWITHRSHNQTVAALAGVAQASAQAAVTAAAQSAASGDLKGAGKAAASAALGAVVLGPPSPAAPPVTAGG